MIDYTYIVLATMIPLGIILYGLALVLLNYMFPISTGFEKVDDEVEEENSEEKPLTNMCLILLTIVASKFENYNAEIIVDILSRKIKEDYNYVSQLIPREYGNEESSEKYIYDEVNIISDIDLLRQEYCNDRHFLTIDRKIENKFESCKKYTLESKKYRTLLYLGKNNERNYITVLWMDGDYKNIAELTLTVSFDILEPSPLSERFSIILSDIILYFAALDEIREETKKLLEIIKK